MARHLIHLHLWDLLCDPLNSTPPNATQNPVLPGTQIELNTSPRPPPTHTTTDPKTTNHLGNVVHGGVLDDRAVRLDPLADGGLVQAVAFVVPRHVPLLGGGQRAGGVQLVPSHVQVVALVVGHLATQVHLCDTSNVSVYH